MDFSKFFKKNKHSLKCLLTLFLFAGALIANAQVKTIKGIVTSNGEPVPGVNIIVKNTTNGTTTDFDGNYVLTNVSMGETLVFSFVGLKTTEIVVAENDTIDVDLEEDASTLEEVVVIGYGTQKKSDLTGAVASVASDDIEKFTFNDPTEALQGKMAGVSVRSQGGAPGSNALISIRGIGTFGDSGPLFVIDGMLTGNMNAINPSDIENISVLKDASASAIYGSRAANGVIIITTKKGTRGGKITIDLDTSYGIQEIIKNYDWADAQQYVTIVNRADDNDGVAIDSRPTANVQFDPNFTSNLYDESIRTSTLTNHNLRISGGGENSLYSVSLNQLYNEGIVKFSDFKRTTVRANSTFDMGKFKFENAIGLTRTVNNPNPYFNKERNLLPTIRLMNDDGDWSSSDIVARGFDQGTPLGGFYGSGTIINELGYAALEDRTVTRNTLLGNIAASYEILDGLTYKLSLGLDYYTDNNYTFTPDHPVIRNAGNITKAELKERNTNFLSTLVEHTLNYKKIFNKHSIDVLAGFTEQKTNIRQLGIDARGFPNNNIRVASLAEEYQNAPSFDRTSSIQSYIGRINYVFDDRYLFTATLRRDASSLFLKELRDATFPSMAIGWNFSNEKFMEGIDAITNIKIRASYGEIGSNNVDIYAIDPELNLFSEYVLGVNQTRVTGYSTTKGINPNIFWETTDITDIGLEFSTFQNKLDVSMDYYIKNSNDILIGIQLPLYFGFNNEIPFNTATVKNKGFEFVGTYRDNIGDLNFTASANFSTLNNEVTSLGGASPIIQGSFTSNSLNSTKTDIGQPIGSFFGFIVDGIYQSDAEALAANDTKGNVTAGDFRFRDLDGDGDIDDDDRTYLGNPIPTFEYGINLTAEYKNFDLSLFFNGVSGNKVLNSTIYRGYFDFNGNYLADAVNAWTPSNTGSSIPRNTQADPGFNRRMSDFYLENGAYFRLRNAQLGYSLPNDILEKIKISKVRLYVSGINLFTITDYSGFYPEVGRNSRGGTSGQPGRLGTKLFNNGIDEGNYPTPRTYQVGLQVSF